jgi:uncharacterized protein (UPF0147 family)
LLWAELACVCIHAGIISDINYRRVNKTARKELDDSEKSKGTEPSKILEILIDFTNKNASPVYKEATGEGWFG